MTAGNVDNKTLAGRSGAIEATVRAMGQHRTSAGVQESGMCFGFVTGCGLGRGCAEGVHVLVRFNRVRKGVWVCVCFSAV